MKNMATMAAIFALVLTLGAVGWAQGEKKAEGKGKKGPGLMQQADANKDGKVTFEELKAVRPKLTPEKFKQMDTNGDGAIDKTDHAQGKPGQQGGAVGALLKEADADKDGKVTYEEAKAVRPKMTEVRYKDLDKDKDGALTKADLPKEAGEAAAKPGEKPGSKMKAADVNNDGKVTFDELKAVRPDLTQEKFKNLDKDGDGVVTKADRKKPA
jgi:Ca2+-binding EF-hand superfamily protein